MNKNLPKLSFKRQSRNTGLQAVGNPYSSVEIKSDKKWCGTIYAPNYLSANNEWIVRFMVIKNDIMEDGNQNCPWKWISLMVSRFDTEESARDWIKENWVAINQKHTLRKAED